MADPASFTAKNASGETFTFVRNPDPATGARQDSLAALLSIIANQGVKILDDADNPLTYGEPADVVGKVTVVSDSFVAAASAAYVSGDLIANSATAGSVTPLSFVVARANDKPFSIRRARIKTTDTVPAGATVRLHLYKDSPTCTNGDSGAWLTTESVYIGAIDVTLDKHFSDAEKGLGTPNTGAEITGVPHTGTQIIYGLVEARSGFTGTASKTWTVTLEVFQN